MTNSNEKNHYEFLLDYFASNQAEDPARISHPELEVYRSVKDESELRSAAVLLPITRHEHNAESQLVLTVRSENLKSHAGQISLPGGTQEDHDDDASATALRESEEEIGLQSDQVEVIGRLGTLALPSGFLITPIVGIIENDLEFVAQPEEVADIFYTPLDLVLDTSAYQKSSVEYKGAPRTILELHYEDYRIWGATAAILYHLANEISEFGD
ncbi:MAG: CoA pyrophosphatase [Pseudomonadales bacterium]|nr:CoA pyrophosphatase [Pseudomonadales bacterium]